MVWSYKVVYNNLREIVHQCNMRYAKYREVTSYEFYSLRPRHMP